MGQADMQSVADVVALDDERQKRAAEADSALNTAGGMLRAAREALKLTIADVAARTNIKPSHIEAIEEMAIERLPSQPYTMGFVRAYAREVALPEEALMDRFRQQAGYERRDFAPGIKPVRREGDAEGGRELSFLALFAILGLVLFAAWKLLISAAPETPDDSSRFAFTKDDTATAVIVPANEPVGVTETVVEEPVEDGTAPADEPVAEDGPSGGADMAAAVDAAAGEVGISETAPADQAVPVEEEPVAEALELRRLVAVDPVYPPLCEAAAAEIETVTVAFTVSSRGRPINPRITSSTNPCFNGAALAALTRWRYDPATVTADNARQVTRFSFDRPY
ncbi:TonB family protein [Parvularcula lutaonensis]|uniref:TonB family protein n=1 Tax=Parvularcula lutaonensis TaxID=491923 RepID=A0ABV7M771_9PROT|nr:TonB family protein [Parvularcula lutaonensis]GGY41348.1 hypothetical protein GCM10007148_07420 [Parvularcula lutaonensis]